MASSPAHYAELVFNVPVRGSFSYTVPEGVTLLPGVRAVAPFGRRSLTGFVVSVTDVQPDVKQLRPVTRRVDDTPIFGEPELELAHWLSRLYMCSLGEALSAMIPGGRREREPEPGGILDDEEPELQHELSDEQSSAVEAIVSSPEGRFYLEGITGSGKTEVFLRVAQRTLDDGKGVIYLVPEIALTAQLETEVRRRFGDTVAVLHSRMTPSRRLAEWLKIRRGEASVAVGARSAVFAPIPDLGLIIVDEEHEATYKSGSTPRYHARQVAMYRARRSGARIVFGSATPSVEAASLMDSGTLRRLRLTRRLAGGSPPKVEPVDLRRDPGVLSSRLLDAIRENHRRGRQAILFLNRRGFANYFHCRSCGFRMNCSRCSVALTYHKGRNAMVCHHCGYRTRPPSVCPECGSLDVGYGGLGTEQVEETVRDNLPSLVCERLDADAVRKRGVLERTLERFRSGEIDILLGTQMVAKGLNFPGVGLVGIVLADTGLAMPDFRAGERTWSLIVQVAGRAGRFQPDGHVLVQTYNPQHPSVAAAVSGDSAGWYETELSTRRQLGFPPYSRLFRVLFRSRRADRSADAAAGFNTLAREAFGETAEMLGPAECPLAVVGGNHRYHLLILATEFDRTHARLSRLLERTPVPSGVYREVDVDPVALL